MQGTLAYIWNNETNNKSDDTSGDDVEYLLIIWDTHPEGLS